MTKQVAMDVVVHVQDHVMMVAVIIAMTSVVAIAGLIVSLSTRVKRQVTGCAKCFGTSCSE